MAAKETFRTNIIVAGLIIAQLLAMILIALFAFEALPDWHDDSMKIYYHYSRRFIEGEIPYRDYAAEYPPFAILSFGLPHLLTPGKTLTLEEYSYRYLAVNALYCLGISLTILRLTNLLKLTDQEKIQTIALLLIATVVTAFILPWRSDLLPAFLTILAFYFLIAKRPLLSGFAIGLSVLAKVYPVFILPVFGFYLLIKDKFASLKRFVLGGAGSIMLLIPLFVLAPNWLSHFLSYHADRGLEIESVSSGLILLLQMFGIGTAKTEFNYGAFHLVSGYATILIKWLPYLTIAAFMIVYCASYFHFRNSQKKHSHIPTENLVAYMVIVLLTFIASNKVFSPQYIIWFVPFVPLLKIRYASLMVAVFSLTLMLFPFGFLMLLDFHPLSVILLNLRNVYLIGLAIWLFRDYSPFPLQAVRNTKPTSPKL